jgi:2-polyprenyl-6-methoxyphenol hydroxylase-like FAD-dependent oxidoreductase
MDVTGLPTLPATRNLKSAFHTIRRLSNHRHPVMSLKGPVAIVGGGIAGLTLALSLRAQNIASIVYEASSPEERFAGAVMLSPNSLHVLNKLGILEHFKSKGWPFQKVNIVTTEGRKLDEQYLGDKAIFGYDALRVYRNALIKSLKDACTERGVDVRYNKKFISIVSESEKDITIAFNDGTEASHSLLFAADGIHSKIRAAVLPEKDPVYTGVLVVAGAVASSSLANTGTHDLTQPVAEAAREQQPPFVMAPQNADATEFLIGTQRLHPEEDREGWARIAKDRDFHRKFLLDGIEQRSELMQSAGRGIIEESIYTWPFYITPHLERWHSEQGRVVIIGDAAHSLSPTMVSASLCSPA